MITKKILFRCDGGSVPEFGTGHVVRCLILAGELLKNSQVEIAFLMKEFETSIRKVIAHGFPVYVIKREEDEDFKTIKTINEFQPDVFVRDNLESSVELMSLIKKTGIILMAIDDIGDGAQLTDITINPILHNGKALYEGYEYMVLPNMAARDIEKKPKSSKGNIRVFISFGGYDHGDITRKFVNSINSANRDIEYHVVVGELYSEVDSLLTDSYSKPHIKIHQSPEDFSGLLRSCDVAIVSGGLTLFQAFGYGMPCFVISQYEHQRGNADKLSKYDFVKNLGLFSDVDFTRLEHQIRNLVLDEDQIKSKSNSARRLIDGLGTRKVSQIIGVIDRLGWDSNFFNINIAYLYPKLLRESIVKFAFRKCEEDNIECLYYLCNCHDSESVRIAEKFGFHFVDIRLTYGLDINGNSLNSQYRAVEGLKIRPSCEKDAPALSEIAQHCYIDSRYYFDQNFSRALCRKFYSDWIKKSMKGQFDDVVFVATVNNVIAGFISCRKMTLNMGKIGLVGIEKKFQGNHIGRHLVNRAIDWFREMEIPFVEVITQGRNINSQKLYQECGFRSKRTELWYHKWFTKEYRI